VLDLLRRRPWGRGDVVRVIAILARVVALLLVLGSWGTPVVVSMRGRRDGYAPQAAVVGGPWRRRGKGNVAGGRARGLGRRRGDVLMHSWAVEVRLLAVRGEWVGNSMRPRTRTRRRRAGAAGGEGGIWRAEIAQAQRLERRRGRRGDAGDLRQRKIGVQDAVRARPATGSRVRGIGDI
jgi:hypothetical protein